MEQSPFTSPQQAVAPVLEKKDVKQPRIKKVLRALVFSSVVAGVAGVPVTRLAQEAVNNENEQLNHAFQVEDLSLKELLLMSMGTVPYSSKEMTYFAKEAPALSSFLRSDVKTGFVHLTKGDMPTLSDAKKNIQEIREKAKKPVLISADIEGGSVLHIGLTQEDLVQFGVPQEILELRRTENENNLRKQKILRPESEAANGSVQTKRPLPSQEWVGRAYQKILDELAAAKRIKSPAKVEDATKKQKDFLVMMEKYGETIADICEDVGINVIFGPNLDMVRDIDGDKPDEKEDRSFGSNYTVISDLSVSYLKGISHNGAVLPVIKHFGNSFADRDSHLDSAQSVTDKRDGSLVPFRDAIKSSIPENREAYLLAEKKRTEEALAGFAKKPKGKAVLRAKKHPTISPYEQKLRAKLKVIDHNLHSIKDKKDFPLGVMTSVSNSNIYTWTQNSEQAIPVAYNTTQISKITNPKNKDGLGHQGIIISDDLAMKSSGNYIEALHQKIKREDISKEALAVHQALSAGNSVALMKAIAGSEGKIAEQVAKLVDEKVSFSEERSYFTKTMRVPTKEKIPDLTRQKVEEVARKILDLKVSLGLLDKEIIKGKEYYILDPRVYNPSTFDVLKNSLFSNQLPWTEKEGVPEKKQPNSAELFVKAGKNFSLSFWRAGMLPWLREATPFFQVDGDFKEAENERKKLIVVDKSIQKMFVYDLETREFERTFEVGIGKGGLIPRRFVGDHSTPTGMYRLVEKRNDAWWRENKGEPLSDYYGGKDGGMLVLAGQWHPEIAIHGNVDPNLGLVSNGCVRVTNTDVNELERTVPLGSMIVITK